VLFHAVFFDYHVLREVYDIARLGWKEQRDIVASTFL